jgi:hypothetical protein
VDRTRFYIIDWAVHPNLILVEVGNVPSELEETFQERAPPLFHRASEIIHSKKHTLQYKVLVHVLEVHDFTPPADSEVDDPPNSDSCGSGGNGLPGSMHSSLQPWPCIYWIARPTDERGHPLPLLP